MVTLEAPFQNNIQYILHCNHSDASKFGHVQNDFSWGGPFHTARKSAPSLPSLIHGPSLKISHRTKHFRPLPSLLGHVRTHFPPLSWRKKKDKTSKELILKEVRPVQRKSKTCYLQVYVFFLILTDIPVSPHSKTKCRLSCRFGYTKDLYKI